MSRTQFEVGSVVTTTVNLMGNPAGSLGICLNTYPGGGGFVFENGAFDNFSDEDQEMLSYVGTSDEYSKYEFDSVTKLGEDYKAGVFNFQKLREEFNIGG